MNKKIKAQVLSENLFPVVGIGASAGGLDAFKQLITAIPGDSGMAYIIIQHLSAEYESILPEILQKQTTIPVLEITDNIKVMPDHIYIIPSNKMLTANDGVLQLDQRIKGEKLNAIDVFFTSLAEIHQGHSIGVILSGTGKDGTVGLKTIKDAGGITIVQDENSAAYYGMPQSAIDAEVVDFILSPWEIPMHLKELIRTAKIIPSNFTISADLREDEIFKQILALIRIKRGVDFTYYKQTTIRRRILRRKVLNRIKNLKEYYTLLIENKVEQDLLFKDLLIPVTAFFRDAGTFTILCGEILPLVVKEKTKGEPIRIWIAGCSTGEEAYSMAICLQEYLNDTRPGHKVQIFATDISESVIAKARSGIYKKQDMAGVSESRIQQCFTKSNGGYQINKEIRDMCVFACQNFLVDPPFAKIDIVSCRNVLIYMESYLQKKALTTFHYSLNKKGFLLLGKSESTSQSSQQFEVFNLRDKIYTRKAVAAKNVHMAQEQNDQYKHRKNNKPKIAETKKDDYQKAADEALLSKYASAGVIVNEQLDILQFRESTGAYLEAAPGKASLNILKMAREGLSFELRNTLHKAALGNEAIRKEGITIENGKRKVNIEVIPLRNTIDTYFLVLFSDVPVNHVNSEKVINKKGKSKEDAGLLQIEQLKTVLSQAREDMRSITEDQEAAYEEVQSANEELRSSNEEMQSLYEELETSKEEIQSANEELSTLNLELIERNEQLVHSRKYAEAVVTTIHEPFIILTAELRIKSVNKAFYEIFRVTEQQTEGKLFFEWLDGLWNDARLREKLYKILPEHSQFENLEVAILLKEKAESYFSLNARQLINENSDEQLILLAIHDITERKELEKSQIHFLKSWNNRLLIKPGNFWKLM